MNAVLKERYKAPVVTPEMLDIKVASLGENMTEMKADVRDLKADNRILRDKIDDLRDHTEDQFKEMNKYVDQKFDVVNQRFDAVNARLEALTKGLSRIEGIHQFVIWVCGGFLTALISVVTLGKALEWF